MTALIFTIFSVIAIVFLSLSMWLGFYMGKKYEAGFYFDRDRMVEE